MLKNNLALLLTTAWMLLGNSFAHGQSDSDGPHLFHRPGGEVEAIWVVDGKKQSKRFAQGQSVKLPRFAALLGGPLTLTAHSASTGVHEMPEKLLAITDVEGKFDELVVFLQKAGVIDARMRWSFGQGHLVTIGDFVDRGDKVTEVLWLMHRLEREAQSAGGRVHFLLGNHEAMILGGDTRYVADKYRTICEVLELPYESLVGPQTEIGRWLRTRNSVAALGQYVFVHGGLSPQAPLTRDDIDRTNEKIRTGLGVPKKKIRAQNQEVADLIWGRLGPLWYRGYFAREGYGDRPLGEEVDALLRGLRATTIVVGHTKVESPCFIYEPKKVLALDVSWTRPEAVRGLLIDGATTSLIDIRGKSYELHRKPNFGGSK